MNIDKAPRPGSRAAHRALEVLYDTMWAADAAMRGQVNRSPNNLNDIEAGVEPQGESSFYGPRASLSAIEAGIEPQGESPSHQPRVSLPRPPQHGPANDRDAPLPPARVRRPRPQDDAYEARFQRTFHRYNVAGSFSTAVSNILCGLGTFAHIAEFCPSKGYVARKCVAAGFGMGGVAMGVVASLSAVALGFASLNGGEGPRWRHFNCATSILNLVAALAAGAPAMYAYFNDDTPDVCGRGAANHAAFAGFWISAAATLALAIQSGLDPRHTWIFRAANGFNTGLTAVAAILAASPDLCATNETVHHRGGGQAFVAIMNCIGVVVGAVGGACSVIGAGA